MPTSEVPLDLCHRRPWSRRPANSWRSRCGRCRLSPCCARCPASWTAPLPPHLRDRLLGEIGSAGPDLVVDLSEVSFLGAAGLSVLVEAGATAGASGVGLYVVARTRPVLRPLTLTGLDSEFAVFPHVDGVPVRGPRPDVSAG